MSEDVPTFEELKRDLQYIVEIKPEYDRMGRIKVDRNRPIPVKINRKCKSE